MRAAEQPDFVTASNLSKENSLPPAFRLGSKGFSQAVASRFDPGKKTLDGTKKRGFLGVKVGEGK